MPDVLRRHDEVIRKAIEAHRGYVFKTVGDAFYAAFWRASDGGVAAVEAQRALAADDSDRGRRIARAHGAAQRRDRRARRRLLRPGGEPRSATLGGRCTAGRSWSRARRRNSCAARCRSGIDLRDLGEHRLKDLVEPERVWQAARVGLAGDVFAADLAGLAAEQLAAPADRVDRPRRCRCRSRSLGAASIRS